MLNLRSWLIQMAIALEFSVSRVADAARFLAVRSLADRFLADRSLAGLLES